jgi:menaquinol-cytochrome c reductase iron-sulfur subunit
MLRRQILTSGRGALALLIALTCAPALRFWWRSARRHEPREAEWADMGPAARVEEGPWQGRTVRTTRRDRWRETTFEEAVYVRRKGDEIEVLSSVCPHTGCLVRRQGDGFDCPCHRSRFDGEGLSQEGPAPRPLDRLESKVEGGRLLVRYQRFRPGTARKEPLPA